MHRLITVSYTLAELRWGCIIQTTQFYEDKLMSYDQIFDAVQHDDQECGETPEINWHWDLHGTKSLQSTDGSGPIIAGDQLLFTSLNLDQDAPSTEFQSLLNLLSPQQIAALSRSQIQRLNPSEFQGLTPERVLALSSEQIGWLVRAQLQSLPLESCTAEQLRGIRPELVLSLDRTQVAALRGPQLAGLTTEQLRAFTQEQVGAIAPGSLRSLNLEQVHAVSEERRNFFSAAQLAELSQEQLNTLGNSLVSGLASIERLQSLTLSEMRRLRPDEIGRLLAGQASAFSPAQLGALSPNQVAAFTKDHVQLFSPQQIRAFTPEQLCALSSEAWRHLPSSLISSLSETQIAGLSVWHLRCMPSAPFSLEQARSISVDTMRALEAVDPTNHAWYYVRTMTPEQVRTTPLHLSGAVLRALMPDQVRALTGDQLRGFDDTRLQLLLEGSAREALTTAQLQEFRLSHVQALLGGICKGRGGGFAYCGILVSRQSEFPREMQERARVAQARLNSKF